MKAISTQQGKMTIYLAYILNGQELYFNSTQIYNV